MEPRPAPGAVSGQRKQHGAGVGGRVPSYSPHPATLAGALGEAKSGPQSEGTPFHPPPCSSGWQSRKGKGEACAAGLLSLSWRVEWSHFTSWVQPSSPQYPSQCNWWGHEVGSLHSMPPTGSKTLEGFWSPLTCCPGPVQAGSSRHAPTQQVNVCCGEPEVGRGS